MKQSSCTTIPPYLAELEVMRWTHGFFHKTSASDQRRTQNVEPISLTQYSKRQRGTANAGIPCHTWNPHASVLMRICGAEIW